MRSTKLPLWIEHVLGLHPIAPPPHVFALEEGTLRYGCFRQEAKGYVYEREASQEVPVETFGDGVLGAPIRKPEAFAEAVESLMRGIPEPIKSASLVLPDTWMRLTFTEISELPRKIRAREEMLRWKLKRLVPFRVEDLRISATRVTPFPTQDEPVRMLIGFSIELLISQIEEAFSAVGVELGRITNHTLAIAASLAHSTDPNDLTGLAVVHSDAYTLSFFHRGEPLIYRYKAYGEALSGGAVCRDLRLTTSFLRQHFPQTPLSRMFLAAPLELEDSWLEWLSDEIDIAPEPLAFEHFPITRTQVGPTWLEAAPLLGAASLEVA